MGKVIWQGIIGLLLLVCLVLTGCSGPALERVDVTWETDPPPKWGVYPGSRQEIPCPLGASYRVDFVLKGKVFAKGTVRSVGQALHFEPAKGGDLEVDEDGNRLTLDVLLPADNGQRERRKALRVERDGEKIVFTVLK